MTKTETFDLFLIRVTRYDSDGYPVHWFRSTVPSNSLACMTAIAQDASARKVLGAGVEIRVHAIDEANSRASPARILRSIRRAGAKALVGMVGVQSNQFPRAMDLARIFLEAGIPVCVGGFHVSGSMAMLGEPAAEIKEALTLGVSLFLGEAEEQRFDRVLRDAYHGRLEPIYDYNSQTPSLANQPLPVLPEKIVKRGLLQMSSFDLGRGCPFLCSFCCIINVQGRKSRFRTADDLEAILMANHAMGIHTFFLTDDNFARNMNWEQFADRMIDLQHREGFRLKLYIQVDTSCHRIANFIDKMVRAGAENIFIGLENINPDNLLHMRKRQNRITEYRQMLLAWKRHPVMLYGGYIIGLPADTRDSILRDIEIIKRELPLDVLSVTFLTPLPGSEDHKRMYEAGEWMDPDLNKYDLTHRVFHHPRMGDDEFDNIFKETLRSFYSADHLETVLRRQAALGSDKCLSTATRFIYYGTIMAETGEYSLETGFVRMKFRRDRRPGLPRENAVWFYAKFLVRSVRTFINIRMALHRAHALARQIWADPARFDYIDRAIEPVRESDLDELSLFTETRGGEGAARKHRRNEQRKIQVTVEAPSVAAPPS